MRAEGKEAARAQGPAGGIPSAAYWMKRVRAERIRKPPHRRFRHDHNITRKQFRQILKRHA
jgi:ribosomal protein L19E